MQVTIVVKKATFETSPSGGLDVEIHGTDGSLHRIPYIRNSKHVQPNQKMLWPYYQSNSADAGWYDLEGLTLTLEPSTVVAIEAN